MVEDEREEPLSCGAVWRGRAVLVPEAFGCWVGLSAGSGLGAAPAGGGPGFGCAVDLMGIGFYIVCNHSDHFCHHLFSRISDQWCLFIPRYIATMERVIHIRWHVAATTDMT